MKHLLRWWQFCVVLGLIAMSGVRAHATLPIEIDFADSPGEGFYDPTLGAARRASFSAAAQVWSRRLTGTVPLRIQANFDPLGGTPNSATLGQAGPGRFFTNWNGARPAPIANTYYAVGLANQFAGGDLDSADADIVAEFNSDVDGSNVLGDVDFYYGLDGNAGNDTDFFSVVLHELGHGLGFTGLLNGAGQFSGGGTAISSFDRFLATSATQTTGNVVNLSESGRAAAIRSNSLFFAGPNARAAGGGTNAKLYAPADYTPGSSVYHLDEDTYAGNEELMTPLSSSNPRDVGPVNFGVFLDIGWGNLSSTPNPTPTATPLRPANDNFERAQVLAGNSGSVNGSNVNATKQTGEPAHARNNGGASIWYRWTASANGSAVITTQGSDFDTLLAVYTGTTVNSLTLVAENDDASPPGVRTSRVEFTTVAGRTYYVAVDGFNEGVGAIETGKVVLDYVLTPDSTPTPTPTLSPTATPRPTATPARPANDNFASAQIISGTANRLIGTNLNATSEPRETRFAGSGRTVWYRWTAPANGRWTFTTRGSTRDTVLTVFTGTSVSATTLIAFDDDDLPSRISSATFNAIAGTDYYLVVDDKTAPGGTFVLQWNLAPPSDNFINAKLLPGTGGRSVDRNLGASREVGEPLHARQVGGASIWYRWRAPANGTATFTTNGSNFDTLLNVYTGTVVNALRNVAFADDTGAALTGSVTFSVVANTEYFIAVEGKNNAQGSVTLGYSSVFPPANDAFANAQVLAGSSGNLNVSNLNATHEIGEPLHAGAGRSRSIWFKWTAPGNGRVTWQGYASAYSPVVAAYTGNAVNRLVAVADTRNDIAASSTIGFNAVAGTTYFIVLDSRDDRAGASGLRWNFTLSAQNLVRQLVPSTVSARSATDEVQLFFANSLPASFGDAEKYTISINGIAVEIEGVSVVGGRVALILREGTLRFGDRISVESALWKGASTCIAQ